MSRSPALSNPLHTSRSHGAGLLAALLPGSNPTTQPVNVEQLRAELAVNDLYPADAYDEELITQLGEEINAEMAQRLTKVIKTALIHLNPTDHERFGIRR